MSTATPQNIAAYLLDRLTALDLGARLVVVFDPPARLGLGETLAVAGRAWAVRRYDGNDLALRRELRSDEPSLIWITQDQRQDGKQIDASSIVDLLCKADAVLDLSIAGVLEAITGQTAWPKGAVETYIDILAANLAAVADGYDELHSHIGPGGAIDAHGVRALALHALQPTISVSKLLLFQRETAAEVLGRYVDLLWGAEWSTAGEALLREQARQSPRVPLGNTERWLDVPPDQLAVYVYLRRVLGRVRVPNIANQLRGLAVIGFDPEPLEPWVETVLLRWERNRAWRERVCQAEASLSPADMQRVMALVPATTRDALLECVAQAETPAAFSALMLRLLKDGDWDDLAAVWPRYRPSGLGAMARTPYTRLAQALGDFLDEISFVIDRLVSPVDSSPELARLLDWYTDGRYYDLEYACARASERLRELPPDESDLLGQLQEYMDGLRARVREYLETADQALARVVTGSWGRYLEHARLATNVLADLVKKRRLRPTEQACLWVIVFDGMRWDSWQRTVRPRLLQRYELKEEEKAYVSVLPSWTFVARTSLLAGQPPVRWKTRDGTFTADQKRLTARQFDIYPADVESRLRFYSGMESDRMYLQLNDAARYPWNVLIFNVSDDNLHKVRGNLVSLNSQIEALLDGIMQTLEGLVRPEDTIVVSSDHGFMELDDKDGVQIQDDERWKREAAQQADPLRYRYMLRRKDANGFSFEYSSLRDSPFTVAVGRRWFRRPADSRPPDRYAHGGLSFAEMVVPGSLMTMIVTKRIEIQLKAPDTVTLEEGQVGIAEIELSNHGNQSTDYRLVARSNTDTTAQEFIGQVDPGERRTIRASIRPVYREKGGGTEYVTWELSYAGMPTRRLDEKVIVKPRKDVVEMEFGGLDELER